MTRRAKALDELEPEGLGGLHADDAKKLAIADGDRVRVTSRRGA